MKNSTSKTKTYIIWVFMSQSFKYSSEEQIYDSYVLFCITFQFPFLKITKKEIFFFVWRNICVRNSHPYIWSEIKTPIKIHVFVGWIIHGFFYVCFYVFEDIGKNEWFIWIPNTFSEFPINVNLIYMIKSLITCYLAVVIFIYVDKNELNGVYWYESHRNGILVAWAVFVKLKKTR